MMGLMRRSVAGGRKGCSPAVSILYSSSLRSAPPTSAPRRGSKAVNTPAASTAPKALATAMIRFMSLPYLSLAGPSHVDLDELLEPEDADDGGQAREPAEHEAHGVVEQRADVVRR